MEETKRKELSDSPKPTPFSIADILSRSSSQSSLEARNSEGEDLQDGPKNEGNQKAAAEYHRMPSPDLNVVRELDLLRRNLSQANLDFGQGHLAHLGTFKHMRSVIGYQTKEVSQRQQDEALDMSKSKYLGKE